MTGEEKRGALLFFGKAGCVSCHAVAGPLNEMFSDFQNHVAGIPQIAPFFGVGKGNVIFDGPNADEDFGMEQVSGNPSNRYQFRTSPLRNLALQPAFFHNGSFTRLADALHHHLDAISADPIYQARAAGVDQDLTYRLGPSSPVLARIDPRLAGRVVLNSAEFESLLRFLQNGLRDPRATPNLFCRMVPSQLPSGMTPIQFEGCPLSQP
jgi:cytochrome c peroxidase